MRDEGWGIRRVKWGVGRFGVETRWGEVRGDVVGRRAELDANLQDKQPPMHYLSIQTPRLTPRRLIVRID